jgi:hypothetical protein
VPERPERIRRNGRDEDQSFDSSEKLFRRYTQSHYINGQFSNTGLSFNTPPSVNRERYSQPADALFSEANEFANWGVLSIRVEDLPPSFPVQDPQYSFWPKHRPLEDNYAHSEVWSDRVPPTGEYVKPAPSIRKLFRTMLSQRVVVEIAAAIRRLRVRIRSLLPSLLASSHPLRS